MSETQTAIDWLEWGTPAFARAAREDKPILLSLVAPWCDHCAAMDHLTYARADVARLVDELFVPVRVDTDRRPDINERYNLGGWPTTAFLTPAGEIFGGGTFIEPDRMPAVLRNVADAFVRRRAEIEGAERAAPRDVGLQASGSEAPSAAAALGTPGGAPRALINDPVEWLSAQILELFDGDHGGFGDGAKFPHTPALTLALERYGETGDSRYARVVTISLDGVARLHDEVEGGFFRYASQRDWGRPHTEKVLLDNAVLIRLHLDAAAVFQRGDYLERAGRALRWVHEKLAHPREAGFSGSQAADTDYYSRDTIDERVSRVPPRVDLTQYTDANAEMISTYLRAADVTRDAQLGEFALRSLEQTALNAYQAGSGMAHVSAPDADVRGLLADQVSMVDALLRAHEATGQLPYSMLAAELMEYALRTMWDEERGGLRDRAPGGHDEHGLLRKGLIPFVANCEAARMLSRLSAITGRVSYRTKAEEMLASLGDAYRDDPLIGASYALALREVRDGQLPPGMSLSHVDWRLNEPDDD
jgi:uncharacterized protein YyaL (SSP411 family)